MMNNRANIFVRIATQGLVGFGKAPGTVATLMMFPMVWFLGGLSLPVYYYGALSFSLILIGSYVVYRALPSFSCADPSAIVLDEMVAFLLVFIGVPITLPTLIIGFGLFRFFDIVKPCGISLLESMSGVWGIMLDDCAAALLSNLILLTAFRVLWYL